MKRIAAYVMVLLAVSFVVCVATIQVTTTDYMQRRLSKPKKMFTPTTEQVTQDLTNRYVVIPPIGQLWAFTPDQKVNVTILETKMMDEEAIVYVKISSTAQVNPQAQQGPKVESAIQPGKPATPQPTTPLPITVSLNGVAKLQYELIADEWYLVEISSVNLLPVQK